MAATNYGNSSRQKQINFTEDGIDFLAVQQSNI
jgi:hypothetical protein